MQATLKHNILDLHPPPPLFPPYSINKVGRKVELQVEVDESVIGGLSVSVGERTFDGLVSSRLQEVKSVLEGR